MAAPPTQLAHLPVTSACALLRSSAACSFARCCAASTREARGCASAALSETAAPRRRAEASCCPASSAGSRGLGSRASGAGGLRALPSQRPPALTLAAVLHSSPGGAGRQLGSKGPALAAGGWQRRFSSRAPAPAAEGVESPTAGKDKGLRVADEEAQKELDKQAVAAALVATGADPFVAMSAADEVTAAGGLGEAINERLIALYDKGDEGAAKRNKTYHPFVRPVEGVERRLFALESERLLSDSLLTAISPARSAKYCVPLPNEHRAAVPLFFYNHFGKHRQYSSTAWKFVHLILERTEADHLHAAFNIPGGFNGRFYFFMLHLWILHKRLVLGVNHCMQAEKQRKQFLAHRRRLRESSPGASGRGPRAALEASHSPGEADVPHLVLVSSSVLATHSLTARSERSWSQTAVAQGWQAEGSSAGGSEESAQTRAATEHAPQPGDSEQGRRESQPSQPSDSVCAWDPRREEEEYLTRGHPFLVDEEKVVEGEMVDAELFKLTWDVIKDWLLQKHVPEARFEFELRNCQEYAFGFFAGLDEALTDDEIYASRIKEVLWGNLYSGRISFSNPHLNLLTKYLIRQLTHVMRIHKAYFYKASFTWADFPMSADFPAPRIVPPLAQRVQYGGYTPSVAGAPPSPKAIGGRPMPKQLADGCSGSTLSRLLNRLKSKVLSGAPAAKRAESS
ncbi:hypothetical protein BESB_063730 [Besnoitia besnoiti]|uniref:Ubiquinol-cytochrome c chaperone domain-containing protein n=1 Tax=Besnoitia besnoiti TaxID=94643 RepID=A0A2A9MHR1_BESBE|nr:hypothetical protein BESB_063730 [Besnoitia besnoiti]PFH35486.1 hypothetical protein BESB_063730 [Besnoitia besnoiti]